MITRLISSYVEERNNNTNSQSGQEGFPTSILSTSCFSSLSFKSPRSIRAQTAVVFFLLESKAFPDDQFGFLHGLSVVWQLHSVVERWHKAMDQRNLVHAVLLDAAKAFDRVDHRLLLQSFYSLGVRGISLQ